MYNFKNCLLVVLFNYSDCIRNKDIIKSIYERHFKKIIFYSDYPSIEDDEVNFININKGINGHKIFNHFYKNYKSIIDDSDGLFYTMDDNIINVNILNLFDNNKIIYYKSNIVNVDEIDIWNNNLNIKHSSWFKLDYFNNHNGWWWDGVNGKQAIYNLLNDNEFKQYNINKFSGSFSDWFYLPKKYLTNKLFHLFELFSNHEVFLEIAIPSIIHNIEMDNSQYQEFNDNVLWKNYREQFLNKDYIYISLNHNHDFILHPIKFNENPDSKYWLKDIFCKDRCVIITTINKPTETIIKHINNDNYDVIIVGDNKTPDDYRNLKCIYLDILSQKKLFPELSEIIPYNHYCRKNLGYLYAIKKGYKIIYETDDDNIPYDNFDSILQYNNIQMISEENNKWINIFKYFTNNAYIWPRGFPLSLLKNEPNYLIKETDKIPSIINGLVENDPDVDALFRIICNHQDSIQWDKNKYVLIDNKNVCVFNTQNTFWLNAELFISLIIPCSVSFRYCDILRGIINNIILKETNNYMMYSSPNVVQYRNEHNLISDFKSEYEMYIHNENILNYIDNKKYLYIIQSASKLPNIYNCLRKRDFILLSFKENTQDTTIFYPGSTWTTGRNKLREYILNLKLEYDYYIFLDEDVVFSNCSQEDGFDKFEELLIKYKPFIANPNYDGYYTSTGYILPVEAQTTIWFDGMCNAFSKEAFFSNIIFPYLDAFDDKSWWISQYVLIILCSIHNKEVVLFPDLKISNNIHSEYPKLDVFKEAEEYVFNNLINVTQLNLINDIKSSSIFKILDFLNTILNKFNKINVIDVGCAIGDVRTLIKHNNVFSIGIDPLIEKYKTKDNNLNSYNILYDVAVDIEEGEKNFNITQSLDTSSLYDFDTEITTTDSNTGHFYIPNHLIEFLTNITETKKVITRPLKNIIEENNLKQDIIHILKIDAQGNDLNVVKSLGNYLNNVMFIVIETNSDTSTPLYKNSTHFTEDYEYLKLHNFELITKEILLRDDLDCLYYNKNLITNFDFNWDKKNLKEILVKPENKCNVKSILLTIYNKLLVNNIIKQKDIDILNKWITYF